MASIHLRHPRSTRIALDITEDAISDLDVSSISLSRTTFLTVTVVVLIISNVHTMTMGEREAIGRRKAVENRGEEREKRVGDAVRAFLEGQRRMSKVGRETTMAIPMALADMEAKVKGLVEAADSLEQRDGARRWRAESIAAQI